MATTLEQPVRTVNNLSPPKTSTTTGATHSFIAGLSAGCLSTIAGYAPDTIKVRLQTQSILQPKYNGAVHCFVRMIRDEGPLSLFKGMSTPLCSRAIINALCFSTYTTTMGILNNDVSTSKTPSLGHAFLAGGVAGMVSALVASPSELIKVQLQAGGPDTGGPIQQTRQILKKVGPRGLCIGMTPTIARDVICMGTFFTTTTAISRLLTANDVTPSPLTSLGAGALAGIAGWACCYPFDVWKSNAQDFMKEKGTKNDFTFRGFFKDRYEKKGVRGFYTGLGPTLFRSAPTNATKFFAFDISMRLMGILDGKR